MGKTRRAGTETETEMENWERSSETNYLEWNGGTEHWNATNTESVHMTTITHYMFLGIFIRYWSEVVQVRIPIFQRVLARIATTKISICS